MVVSATKACHEDLITYSSGSRKVFLGSRHLRLQPRGSGEVNHVEGMRE